MTLTEREQKILDIFKDEHIKLVDDNYRAEKDGMPLSYLESVDMRLFECNYLWNMARDILDGREEAE